MNYLDLGIGFGLGLLAGVGLTYLWLAFRWGQLD